MILTSSFPSQVSPVSTPTDSRHPITSIVIKLALRRIDSISHHCFPLNFYLLFLRRESPRLRKTILTALLNPRISFTRPLHRTVHRVIIRRNNVQVQVLQRKDFRIGIHIVFRLFQCLPLLQIRHVRTPPRHILLRQPLHIQRLHRGRGIPEIFGPMNLSLQRVSQSYELDINIR
ncbi:hypothetical protein V8G54_005245 [Vigna mungo]|uniref:Uncharacterized protein n=1 Tax=Vigna mungo TaxID=3915 RepID=A0AAQ3SGI5_VIGMU